MDLNTIGSWASIISFPLSLIAFCYARNIKGVLRARTLESKVRLSFKRLREIHPSRKLTSKIREDIAALIRDLCDFHLGRFWFQDMEAKKFIRRIQNDLQVDPDVAKLKEDLESLEDVIFPSTKVEP